MAYIKEKTFVTSCNCVLLKVQFGFCSGAIVAPISVEFGAKRVG
jgi:hypothetical protein